MNTVPDVPRAKMHGHGSLREPDGPPPRNDSVIPNPRDRQHDSLREQIMDTAVARVFANEIVRKAFRRYGLTASIASQIVAQFNTLALEASRGGP